MKVTEVAECGRAMRVAAAPVAGRRHGVAEPREFYAAEADPPDLACGTGFPSSGASPSMSSSSAS